MAGTNDKVWLVSADGHAGAPANEYRDYVEVRHRRDFDEYLGRHKWRFAARSAESLQPGDLHARFAAEERYDPSTGPAMVWDPALRVKELDRSGIVAEVLFPDDQSMNDPPWGAGMCDAVFDDDYPAELTRVGAMAHNRWLAEFCSTDRQRLLGLTVLGTLGDVELAVQEVTRAYEDGLRTGIVLPLSYELPLYHHPRYEPLWERCEALGLAVVSHASKGGPRWYGDSIETTLQVYLTEFTWFARRPMWCLILGGVLDRHPGLNMVVTESGGSWVAELLQRMDGRSERHGIEMAARKPSDVYRRQCYVAHSSFIRRGELEPAVLSDNPNLIWGADSGHGEGSWPGVVDGLRQLVGGLAEDAMREFLGGGALRAYRLDRDRLAATVERIGPSAADLGLVAPSIHHQQAGAG